MSKHDLNNKKTKAKTKTKTMTMIITHTLREHLQKTILSNQSKAVIVT